MKGQRLTLDVKQVKNIIKKNLLPFMKNINVKVKF